MTPAEQAAFVRAYSTNVSVVDDADVADFVRRYSDGEDIPYSGDYTSIMDALGMWFDATKWQIEQQAPALTASLSELYRHAGDTESGEHAIKLVEQALEQQQ